ncbi:MAG: toll/interleukin-1 receptor domain-containing protein [Myxococcales bacterium]|nr:toll/interleukin-1 receptor domain-containing protein [Myxococcales bacterium]
MKHGAVKTERLVELAISAGLIGAENRRLLLENLPLGFVYSLPTVSRPLDQLRFDLMELARTPRLIGLEDPPLAIWLDNAAKLAAPRVEAKEFAAAARTVRGQPPVVAPETPLPPLAGAGHTVNIGSVSQGSVGVVHGSVTINNHGPPSPAPPAPGRAKLGPLIVIALGEEEHVAREAVGAHGEVIHCLEIEVAPEVWDRKPTDPDWRWIARRVSKLVEGISAKVTGDVAIVSRAPAPMLAWCVAQLHRRHARRRLFFFDPEPFARSARWRPMRPEDLAGVSDDALKVSPALDPPDAAATDVVVHLDLGAPRVKRKAATLGHARVVISPTDVNWRGGTVPPESLVVPLAAMLARVDHAFPEARWHVLYDGPPSLLGVTVQTALRSRQALTLYSVDRGGVEHPALALPRGDWIDPRDPKGRVDRVFDVFLAYPRAAEGLARVIYERLVDRYAVFFDQEKLLPGDVWDEIVPAAQANALVSLLLITPQVDEAWYLRNEVQAAIAHMRETRQKVVPIVALGATKGMLPYGLGLLQVAEWPDAGPPDAVMAQLYRVIDAARAAADQKG